MNKQSRVISDSEQLALLTTVLRAAVEYDEENFDNDESINGANLCEWFAEWRQWARRSINPENNA